MQSRNETNAKPEAEKRQQMKMAKGYPLADTVSAAAVGGAAAAAVHIKTEIIVVQADGHSCLQQ